MDISKRQIRLDFARICNIINIHKHSEITCPINILLVIYGIRPSRWYDCWNLNSSCLYQLLRFLDGYYKDGIRYKFDDGNNYINGDKVVEEGPLIYNKNKLSKNLQLLIKEHDLKKVYNYPEFGEILGYQCPIDIYDRPRCKTISYTVHYKKRYITNLYSFLCPNYKLKRIKKDILYMGKKIEFLLKKISKKYEVVIKY